MTATRRLAAILAVDVVGYSRLMFEDEAGRAKLLHEPCVGSGGIATGRLLPDRCIHCRDPHPDLRSAPFNCLGRMSHLRSN